MCQPFSNVNKTKFYHSQGDTLGFDVATKKEKGGGSKKKQNRKEIGWRIKRSHHDCCQHRVAFAMNGHRQGRQRHVSEACSCHSPFKVPSYLLLMSLKKAHKPLLLRSTSS